MFWVECPTIKAEYQWKNVLATRDSPDDSKTTHMTFFTISSKEYLGLYSMLQHAHRDQAYTNIPKPPLGHFFQYIILQTPKIRVGKLSHFESIASKSVVMSNEAFLKVIENNINLCVAYWSLPLS